MYDLVKYHFAHVILFRASFSMVCAVLQERSKSVEVELESFANSPVFCTVKQKSTAPKSSEIGRASCRERV